MYFGFDISVNNATRGGLDFSVNNATRGDYIACGCIDAIPMV